MAAVSPPETDFLYVDRAEPLAEFCTAIKDVPWLAFDTEFIREKSFYPKLCLIQVGVPGSLACIDPLALEDLSHRVSPAAPTRIASAGTSQASNPTPVADRGPRTSSPH